MHNAGAVARTKKMFRRAFETQTSGAGLLVRRGPDHVPDRMVRAHGDGPDDLQRTLAEVHVMGELKVDGKIKTTEELHDENLARQHEIEAKLAAGGLDEKS